MSFLNESKQEELLNELKSLAELLGVEVVEAAKLPVVTVRVSSGSTSSTITKRGDDFFATHDLPEVPMTFVGGGMFKYRVEV
jgi:nucleotide-binding universal stress UspA family protein